MAEPKVNTRYKCFRTGHIEMEASNGGALMCKIPYQSLDEDPVSGVHSVCVVAKDGSPQELTINSLMTIFKVNDPIELVEIAPAAESLHEFDLSDYEAKEKYPGFRWINPPKSGDISEIKEKYGSILSRFAKNPEKNQEPKSEKKAETKTETPKTPAARKPPTAAKKVETRKSNQDEVWELLTKKHSGVSDDDLANNHLYPALDKVMNKTGFDDLASVTPEQWGQVAAELGV